MVFGDISRTTVVHNAVGFAYNKADLDGKGTIDHKEAYIALLLVYDKINKVAPFHLKPLPWKEFKIYCKKADVSDNSLSKSEFMNLAKMVIGGDSNTWRRSLWFRIVWHAGLELLVFAMLAEYIAKACRVAELPWVSAAAVAVLLKVGYKVASMVANKTLLGEDADD